MSEPSLPLDALRSIVTIMLISTPFGSVLIPLILALFFFSTPESRRHPVFILNILACFCGVCEAIINLTVAVQIIYHPSRIISKSVYVATSAFAIIAGIFIDSILLLRILAFYPFSLTPIIKFWAIFTPPILVKCGRFTLTMIYVYQYTHANSSDITVAAHSIWSRNPYVLAHASLQVIDNSYASGFLLYKINQFRRERNEIFKINSRSVVTFLGSLFAIALGNFVFPVAMNIVSIIMLAANASFNSTTNVFLCSNYISIIGVVFATIWTRSRYWNRDDRIPRSDDFQLQTNWLPPFDRTRTVLSTIQFGSKNEESVHDRPTIGVQGKGKEQDNIDSDLNSSHPSSTKT